MQSINTESHQALSLNHKIKWAVSKTIATVITITAFSTIAYADEKIGDATPAQGRVIEDSFIYDDPTVAKANQWIKGFTIDYYSLSANAFNSGSLTDSGGTVHSGNLTGTQSMQQPGFSAFVGYGDVTALISYRTGSGTVNYSGTLSPGSISAAINNNWTESETEADVRWLLRDYQFSNFVPYVLAGYVSANETQSFTGSCTWTGNSCSISPSTGNATMSIPLIGIGGIIPVSDKFGIRIDDRFGDVTVNYAQGTSSGSTTYNINRLTATMYYNFADSWNAQLGARYESDNQAQSVATTGVYVMLGYTYK